MLNKIFRFFIHHFVKILLSVLIREFIKSVRRDETAKFGLFWRKETAQETELNLPATRKLIFYETPISLTDAVSDLNVRTRIENTE